MNREIRILGGNANPPLVEKICRSLGIEPTKVLVARYNDGGVKGSDS